MGVLLLQALKQEDDILIRINMSPVKHAYHKKDTFINPPMT